MPSAQVPGQLSDALVGRRVGRWGRSCLPVFLSLFLALAGERAQGDQKVSDLGSLSIEVAGVTFVGTSYWKSARFERAGSDYSLAYTCWSPRAGECTCPRMTRKIQASEVARVLEFISSLEDGGERARCCDHPWTEIQLTYSAEPRQRKMTLPFDLLRVEEIFNLCGTPLSPFNPAEAASQFRLGKQLYRVGLRERAEAALEQAIRLDPRDVPLEAHEVLGDTYRARRDYEKALEAYGHVLDARPKDARILLRIGALHSEFDQKAEAIEAYRRAIDVEPGGTTGREAYENLGHIYRDIGRPREAVEVFKQVLRIEPKDAFTRYSLGEVLLGLGDVNGALEQYEALKGLGAGYANDLHRMIHERAPR